MEANQEVPEGQGHLVWTHIGWIETSEAMGVRPYRASDPNARTERPQLCVPAQGAQGRGFGLKRPDKGSEALQLNLYS